MDLESINVLFGFGIFLWALMTARRLPLKISAEPKLKPIMPWSLYYCAAVKDAVSVSVLHLSFPLCSTSLSLWADSILSTRPLAAYLLPPAHSVGRRFNGSCATESNLWARQGIGARGKDESGISAKMQPPPLTTTVLWIIFSVSPFLSLPNHYLSLATHPLPIKHVQIFICPQGFQRGPALTRLHGTFISLVLLDNSFWWKLPFPLSLSLLSFHSPCPWLPVTVWLMVAVKRNKNSHNW